MQRPFRIDRLAQEQRRADAIPDDHPGQRQRCATAGQRHRHDRRGVQLPVRFRRGGDAQSYLRVHPHDPDVQSRLFRWTGRAGVHVRRQSRDRSSDRRQQPLGGDDRRRTGQGTRRRVRHCRAHEQRTVHAGNQADGAPVRWLGRLCRWILLLRRAQFQRLRRHRDQRSHRRDDAACRPHPAQRDRGNRRLSASRCQSDGVAQAHGGHPLHRRAQELRFQRQSPAVSGRAAARDVHRYAQFLERRSRCQSGDALGGHPAHPARQDVDAAFRGQRQADRRHPAVRKRHQGLQIRWSIGAIDQRAVPAPVRARNRVEL